MKILVVDDHRLNRELLGYILSDHNYEFVEADTGLAACEKVAEDESIDLILMDVNMPEMNGYDATAEIRRNAGDRFLPIIFVTALDDDETLAQCLAVGGDDFVGKPVNENVLLAKLKAHHRTLKYHRQLQDTNNQLNYHKMLMEREHAIVDHVMTNSISRSEMNCDNVKFRVAPMTMFNGDVLMVAPSPSGGVYVMLGDFTGHGLSAAIGCLPVSDIFYAMTAKQAHVGEIASEINTRLQSILPSNMFLCAALIELNHSGDHLTLWSGGMNDLLLVTAGGDVVDRFNSQHMPLGILLDKEFDSSARDIKPATGTYLYVYTDGVIEAHSDSDTLFGEARLEALFSQPSDNRIEQIFSAVEDFRAGDPQDDDISVLELRCNTVIHSHDDDNHFCILPPVYSSRAMSLPWKVSLQLNPPHLRAHKIVPQLLQAIVNVHGLSEHQDLLYTILTELYNNSLEHGILQLQSSTKRDAESFSDYYQARTEKLKDLSRGKLLFELEVVPAEENSNGINQLVMSFVDDGPGFDVEKVLARSLDEHDLSFGRGIALVSSLCDSVEYTQSGRKVRVVYSLD